MTVIRTHNALRLGDNLAVLHFLRAMAQHHPERRFIHYAHLPYIHQLAEVVCDLPNLQVCALESVSGGIDYWKMAPDDLGSIDTWKDSDGMFYANLAAVGENYAEFMLGYFRRLAARMGLESPLVEPKDLLFDFPALTAGYYPKFDFLVINSAPQSGQFPAFNSAAMETLVGELAQRGSVVTTAPTRHNVPCTAARCMTVAQIGSLSRFCRCIVAMATGPMWTCWNTFNQESVEFRVVLIGSEKITYATNTQHAANANEARRVLQIQGLL